jgi:hypothetical protein
MYNVMVSVLASSVVDRRFELRSGQTKDYKIGTCWFSAKHSALKRKIKDWLAQNQHNVSEWSNMSTRGLLFQWANTIFYIIPTTGTRSYIFTSPKVKVEFRYLFSLQKLFSLCSSHKINANIAVFCWLAGLQWNNTRF